MEIGYRMNPTSSVSNIIYPTLIFFIITGAMGKD